MPKFYCTACGYSFYPRKTDQIEPPRRCPYCDKEGSLIKEQTSSDLLKEV